MKKKIQKIIGCLALSAWLASYTPALATTTTAASQADDKNKNDNGSCDVSRELPFGVKLWTKFAVKDVIGRYSTGLEFSLGPFVEWKPFDKIGIQTGLMYGYNDLDTAGFSLLGKLVDGWSGRPESRKNTNASEVLIDIDNVNFHLISIPLSIRCYLGSDHKFALHWGLRWMTLQLNPI